MVIYFQAKNESIEKNYLQFWLHIFIIFKWSCKFNVENGLIFNLKLIEMWKSINYFQMQGIQNKMLYITLPKRREKIKSCNGNRWKSMFICIMSLSEKNWIVTLFMMDYMITMIHDMKTSSYIELCYHPQLVKILLHKWYSSLFLYGKFLYIRYRY